MTTRIGVLRAFKSGMASKGISGVYVSHDLAVVAQVANRIVVLRGGEVQEEGDVDGRCGFNPRSAANPVLCDDILRQLPLAHYLG